MLTLLPVGAFATTSSVIADWPKDRLHLLCAQASLARMTGEGPVPW